MINAIPMNSESLIYDEPGGKTINGIEEGFFSQGSRQLLGPDGKPKGLDLTAVVEVFHGLQDAWSCVFSGEAADSVMFMDNNNQNILITNMAPVNGKFMDELSQLPRPFVNQTFDGPDFEVEIELFGVPGFLLEQELDKIQIPQVPPDLGLAYDEAQLWWIWNDLTKRQLLKGVTNLTKRNKQTKSSRSVSLTNIAVLETVMRHLQEDPKESHIVC